MTSIDGGKLSHEELERYWARLSNDHLSAEDDGLSAICYAGMPEWFNRFMDVYQRKALTRLVGDLNFAGKRVLDVGTGVGRWARWYSNRALCEVVGIDIEPSRLQLAREYGGRDISYQEMPANRLEFIGASFDVVNSVTVLQHVDHNVKQEAIAEFGRIVRPGGHAVIFEDTDPGEEAPHVYPWTQERWISEFRKNGFALERTVGEQYIPVLRIMKRAFRAWRGTKAREEIDLMKNSHSLPRSRAMLGPLKFATALSYPIEEVARFLPSRYARITGFLFVKQPDGRNNLEALKKPASWEQGGSV